MYIPWSKSPCIVCEWIQVKHSMITSPAAAPVVASQSTTPSVAAMGTEEQQQGYNNATSAAHPSIREGQIIITMLSLLLVGLSLVKILQWVNYSFITHHTVYTHVNQTVAQDLYSTMFVIPNDKHVHDYVNAGTTYLYECTTYAYSMNQSSPYPFQKENSATCLKYPITVVTTAMIDSWILCHVTAWYYCNHASLKAGIHVCRRLLYS